jgi:hypothetical protein
MPMYDFYLDTKLNNDFKGIQQEGYNCLTRKKRKRKGKKKKRG